MLPRFRQTALRQALEAHAVGGRRSPEELADDEDYWSIDGLEPGTLAGWLFERHRIVTTPISHPEFDGLRVTPNVYTTLEEVDLFAEKLLSAVRSGLS
jgi:hypothetical protein